MNPTLEEVLAREPLLNYSFFLSSKNTLLLDLVDDILEKLDSGFSEGKIFADTLGEASVLTWFWTLGAYEVTRTMCQTKDCFSSDILARLELLKNQLAQVRGPNSKMEKRGQKAPVSSNRSFDGWDIENKDLLIGDPDMAVSARFLLKLYDTTMTSIQVQNVLKRHEESVQYANRVVK